MITGKSFENLDNFLNRQSPIGFQKKISIPVPLIAISSVSNGLIDISPLINSDAKTSFVLEHISGAFVAISGATPTGTLSFYFFNGLPPTPWVQGVNPSLNSLDADLLQGVFITNLAASTSTNIRTNFSAYNPSLSIKSTTGRLYVGIICSSSIAAPVTNYCVINISGLQYITNN